MGMYDSVMVPCPECGKDVEFQSKAGYCIREVYKPNSVPVEIAADLDLTAETCASCGTKVELRMMTNRAVPMEYRKYHTIPIEDF